MNINHKNRFLRNYGGILLALLLIAVFFSLLSQYFLTVNNLLSVLLQVSIISITAFGMTYALMIGGIDLSVGSIIALAGMVFAITLNATGILFVAIAAAITAGLIVGFINGIIIAKLEIPPFIVTVATMGIFRGVAYSFTDSKPVPIELPSALAIGNDRFLFIPIPVWIVLVLLIISHIVLDKTKLGRQTKLVGGNRESAKYAGVNTAKIEVIVFMITGLASAVSGIILTSRLYSAQPNAALGYELDAIAAAVLGGTSLSGGYGSVIGTFIGALIIGIVNNGMNLLGLSYFYQLIIKGIIILIAVYADIRNKKKMLKVEG
ncbi:ABC transporter permease [Oceanispirochaeta crateris]|uniref:ABC transporter permease n=1 Tax=Oceanispirochaeta crateris TaxID=2518645 RepID=A0A5C1QH87_9SPIO|nr:ABC transporter permease [Oceanispirochaeta crateris]QEN06449.1 ABC transporter permease [Oceanispirochaeta crateris]QEN09808.1 ABC transporter permease [Oceanispirochaeta crateris]